MAVIAGIDEAGYGPLLGPLLVGRVVMVTPDHDADPWELLSDAVCRNLTQARRGRIAVNDSKKLKSAASGIRHLEIGCLAFASLAGRRPARIDHWLDALGEKCHRDLADLPWYAPSAEEPWDDLPARCTAGEIAVARGMLATSAHRADVAIADIGAAVVFEDRFNEMVATTRSKAATSYTFVARHLRHVWDRFGPRAPIVVVDRQGGRTDYRELLAQDFPGARLTVQEQSPEISAYHLEDGDRRMQVSFKVDAEQQHMPVALASMIAKYTRELLMARFNAYFGRRLPQVRPTAGYATDGRRWLDEVTSHLDNLGIDRDRLRRRA